MSICDGELLAVYVFLYKIKISEETFLQLLVPERQTNLDETIVIMTQFPFEE